MKREALVEFTSDSKTKAISDLTDALFKNVLYDEEPIFIGDDASMLDVSVASPAEIQKRCAAYYKATLSLDDLRRPLWELLPELERGRVSS